MQQKVWFTYLHLHGVQGKVKMDSSRIINYNARLRRDRASDTPIHWRAGAIFKTINEAPGEYLQLLLC